MWVDTKILFNKKQRKGKKKEKEQTTTKKKKHKRCTTQLLTTHCSVPSQGLSSGCPPPSNSSPFDCSAWHRMVRDILLTSLGLLTWFCALSASCASPAFLLAGQPKELISHWLSVNTAQLQVKHGRDITFFHPKSKTQHLTSYYEEN